MTGLIKRLKDSRGATSIEYALIASLVSIAAISAFADVGSNMNAAYTDVESKL